MISSSLHEMARLLGGEIHAEPHLSVPDQATARRTEVSRSGSTWREESTATASPATTGISAWTMCGSDLGLPVFEPGEVKQTAAKDLRTPQERLAAALQDWEKDVADRRADAGFASRLWGRAVDPGGTGSAAYLAHRRLELDEGMAGRLVRHLEDCPRGPATSTRRCWSASRRSSIRPKSSPGARIRRSPASSASSSIPASRRATTASGCWATRSACRSRSFAMASS